MESTTYIYIFYLFIFICILCIFMYIYICVYIYVLDVCSFLRANALYRRIAFITQFTELFWNKRDCRSTPWLIIFLLSVGHWSVYVCVSNFLHRERRLFVHQVLRIFLLSWSIVSAAQKMKGSPRVSVGGQEDTKTRTINASQENIQCNNTESIEYNA